MQPSDFSPSLEDFGSSTAVFERWLAAPQRIATRVLGLTLLVATASGFALTFALEHTLTDGRALLGILIGCIAAGPVEQIARYETVRHLHNSDYYRTVVQPYQDELNARRQPDKRPVGFMDFSALKAPWPYYWRAKQWTILGFVGLGIGLTLIWMIHGSRSTVDTRKYGEALVSIEQEYGDFPGDAQHPAGYRFQIDQKAMANEMTLMAWREAMATVILHEGAAIRDAQKAYLGADYRPPADSPAEWLMS